MQNVGDRVDARFLVSSTYKISAQPFNLCSVLPPATRHFATSCLPLGRLALTAWPARIGQRSCACGFSYSSAASNIVAFPWPTPTVTSQLARIHSRTPFLSCMMQGLPSVPAAHHCRPDYPTSQDYSKKWRVYSTAALAVTTYLSSTTAVSNLSSHLPALLLVQRLQPPLIRSFRPLFIVLPLSSLPWHEPLFSGRI